MIVPWNILQRSSFFGERPSSVSVHVQFRSEFFNAFNPVVFNDRDFTKRDSDGRRSER
jgi:hypothetical protein